MTGGIGRRGAVGALRARLDGGAGFDARSAGATVRAATFGSAACLRDGRSLAAFFLADTGGVGAVLRAAGVLEPVVFGARLAVPAREAAGVLDFAGAFLALAEAFAGAAGLRAGRLAAALRAADGWVAFLAAFRLVAVLAVLRAAGGAAARTGRPELVRLRLDGGLRRVIASSIRAPN